MRLFLTVDRLELVSTIQKYTFIISAVLDWNVVEIEVLRIVRFAENLKPKFYFYGSF